MKTTHRSRAAHRVARPFAPLVLWPFALAVTASACDDAAGGSGASAAARDAGARLDLDAGNGAGGAPETPDAPLIDVRLAADAAADTDPAPDTPAEGVCTPDDVRCPDEFTVETCAPDGRGWAQTGVCGGDERCQRDAGGCAPIVCEPGEARCADEQTALICLNDGSEFGVVPCDDEEVCTDGRCLAPLCFPGVMFAVDRSSSMGPHWQDVRRAVAATIMNNPAVRFGLSAFPSENGGFVGCASGDWPHVPIQPDAGPAIDAWFAGWDVGGATPISSTMEYMAANVDALWGAERGDGYLIVLSDGADTCSCSLYDEERQAEERIACIADELTTATQSLATQGIHTYVIGYAYGDDPTQLEVMAANGDTETGEYLVAGSEASLTLVFDQILRDVKFCQ
ncbi:VWA domain-containing protein [Myxococcota bacterium]|nr:VWA domain-containing protein [Myxococcota bacterium]